ncbi:MAG: hypothetical protein RG741_06440 [Bacteroidales bacterium]|nr:hypothetical protein [Bacteroidales bacterium]
MTTRALLLLFSFVFFAAGNQVHAMHSAAEIKNDEPPCTDVYFYSDAHSFRATGIGTHRDYRTSERIARLDAGAHLIANISVSIASVTNRYLQQQALEDDVMYHTVYQQLTNISAEQFLRNIRIICVETDFDQGVYITRMAVEVSTRDVLSDLQQDFASDTLIQHLYDEGVLEKVFQEELDGKGDKN